MTTNLWVEQVIFEVQSRQRHFNGTGAKKGRNRRTRKSLPFSVLPGNARVNLTNPPIGSFFRVVKCIRHEFITGRLTVHAQLAAIKRNTAAAAAESISRWVRRYRLASVNLLTDETELSWKGCRVARRPPAINSTQWRRFPFKTKSMFSARCRVLGLIQFNLSGRLRARLPACSSFTGSTRANICQHFSNIFVNIWEILHMQSISCAGRPERPFHNRSLYGDERNSSAALVVIQCRFILVDSSPKLPSPGCTSVAREGQGWRAASERERAR